MTIMDVHFNEEIYPNPKDFVPERWLGDAKAPDGNSLDRYFVAFGKGPKLDSKGIRVKVKESDW